MNDTLFELHIADHNFRANGYEQQQRQMDARFTHHDPEHVVGSQRYIELLGADVDHTRHMVRTLALTSAFVRQHNLVSDENSDIEPITERETQLLRLAAITHDWGELLVGDIKYDKKTQQDEKDERIAYKQIFDSLQLGEEIDKQTRDEVIEIIFGEDSRLSLIFNSIERVGYILTSLRAHRMITQFALVDEEQSQMTRIKLEVSARHTKVLLERAAQLPVAGQVVAQFMKESNE